MDQSKYTSWVELFRVHCEAFDCDDHLESSTPPNTTASTEKDIAAADKLKQWKRIDAIVRQWIYGTISPDLLQTILKPSSTAHSAWYAIQGIFNDNQNTRALYLQNKFSNTKLESYPNISLYCQALKEIADQLANVSAPVSDQRLVLQLIVGLNEQYDGVAMLLQQTDPLPDFHKPRSHLILEETHKVNQTPPPSAALAAGPNHEPPPPTNHQPVTITYPNSNRQPTDPSTRCRGRGRGHGSRSRSRGRSPTTYTPPGYPQTPWSAAHYSPWSWNAAPPPYSYPTIPPRPAYAPRPTAPGLLGPHPQAHYAYQQTYTPTQLDQAFSTMTLNLDPTWYMDSGATAHMSYSSGLPDADSHPAM